MKPLEYCQFAQHCLKMTWMLFCTLFLYLTKILWRDNSVEIHRTHLHILDVPKSLPVRSPGGGLCTAPLENGIENDKSMKPKRELVLRWTNACQPGSPVGEKWAPLKYYRNQMKSLTLWHWKCQIDETTKGMCALSSFLSTCQSQSQSCVALSRC